jgi:hypothetical protein
MKMKEKIISYNQIKDITHRTMDKDFYIIDSKGKKVKVKTYEG